MTMGIMPVTGIPLPFMSYGGSSLITSFACIGLVANVSHAPLQLTASALTTARRQVRGRLGRLGREMSNLWPRVEPLLARVEKPARYIGMERGSQRPEHRPSSTPGSSSTPTPTRSGCPTRGSRSSTRSSTNATTRWPSAPTRPGSTSNAEMRAAWRAAVLGRHPPPGRRLRRARLRPVAELVYTNVLSCLDLAGVPVRAEDRRPEHPLVIVGGHCAFNPEPMADFVDAFVIGDGEEAGGRDHRGASARGSAAVARRGRRVLRELATIPGVYVPSMYEVDVRRRRASRRSRPRVRRRPRSGRQAHRRRPRGLALPEEPARAADRGRARPPQRRGLPRLHAGCRFCQAGMITRPVRERPADQVRTMVERRPAAHRLRRGRAHVAVDRRLLRHRGARRRTS